jgi:leucyl aminopeptidase
MPTPDQELDCIAATPDGARPLHAVRPAGLAGLLASLPPAQAGYLRDTGFAAASQELALFPGADGVGGAVLGLGEDRSPYAFGGLALRLPARSVWEIQPGEFDATQATLGFCLGGYRFTAYRPAPRAPALLVAPAAHGLALSQARAAWMVRDLINTPANDLGPAELTRRSPPWGAARRAPRASRACDGPAARPGVTRRSCRSAARASASTAGATT